MVTVTTKSRARLRTSMGDMTLEFLVEKAPRTVENFVTLAKKGYYDGLTFHRVIRDFIVQGGCRNGDGTGRPEYTIRPEFNDTPHIKGTVSMARNNDPHSAFSQFFICHGEPRYLDSRYTAFARVVDGLDVLDKIAGVPTDIESRFSEKSVPRDPIYINGVDLSGVEFSEADTAPHAMQGQGRDGALAEPAGMTRHEEGDDEDGGDDDDDEDLDGEPGDEESDADDGPGDGVAGEPVGEPAGRGPDGSSGGSGDGERRGRRGARGRRGGPQAPRTVESGAGTAAPGDASADPAVEPWTGGTPGESREGRRPRRRGGRRRRGGAGGGGGGAPGGDA